MEATIPYDSQGIASVSGNRPVNGQDTDAAQINVPLADIQSMLSQVLLKSGVAPMTGNLNMNGFKINGLGEATNDSDPVTLAQLTALLAQQRTVPVGAVQPLRSKTAPAGWLIEDGKTIGSASSGATGRANADTQDLFTHLWTQFTNTELVIQTSTGAASTRGATAASDFAANKRMPLFDSRTRFLRGSDSGLAFDATLVPGLAQDDVIKNHTHTVPPHDHSVPSRTRPEYAANNGGDRIASVNSANLPGSSSDPMTTGNTALTTNNNASGSALETRPRASVALFCIKL